MIVLSANIEGLSANMTSILSAMSKKEHCHCLCQQETHRSTETTLGYATTDDNGNAVVPTRPSSRGGTAKKKILHLADWSQLIHPGPASSRPSFFMESSQSCAATLTHYLTEPPETLNDLATNFIMANNNMVMPLNSGQILATYYSFTTQNCRNHSTVEESIHPDLIFAS